MSACLIVGVALLFAGCGRAQVSPDNRRLVVTLRTAVSARNTTWLDQNEQLVEQRRRDGQMGDAEYREFRRIVDHARAGEWTVAESELIKLAKAQRPTPEDLRRSQPGYSHEH